MLRKSMPGRSKLYSLPPETGGGGGVLTVIGTKLRGGGGAAWTVITAQNITKTIAINTDIFFIRIP